MLLITQIAPLRCSKNSNCIRVLVNVNRTGYTHHSCVEHLVFYLYHASCGQQLFVIVLVFNRLPRKLSLRSCYFDCFKPILHRQVAVHAMPVQVKKVCAKQKFSLSAKTSPQKQTHKYTEKCLADIDANEMELSCQMEVPPPTEDITEYFDWGAIGG